MCGPRTRMGRRGSPKDLAAGRRRDRVQPSSRLPSGIRATMAEGWAARHTHRHHWRPLRCRLEAVTVDGWLVYREAIATPAPSAPRSHHRFLPASRHPDDPKSSGDLPQGHSVPHWNRWPAHNGPRRGTGSRQAWAAPTNLPEGWSSTSRLPAGGELLWHQTCRSTASTRAIEAASSSIRSRYAEMDFTAPIRKRPCARSIHSST